MGEVILRSHSGGGSRRIGGESWVFSLAESVFSEAESPWVWKALVSTDSHYIDEREGPGEVESLPRGGGEVEGSSRKTEQKGDDPILGKTGAAGDSDRPDGASLRIYTRTKEKAR